MSFDFSAFKSDPPHGMYVERADHILQLTYRNTTFTVRKPRDEFELFSRIKNRKENGEYGDMLLRSNSLPRILQLLGYLKLPMI